MLHMLEHGQLNAIWFIQIIGQLNFLFTMLKLHTSILRKSPTFEGQKDLIRKTLTLIVLCKHASEY